MARVAGGRGGRHRRRPAGPEIDRLRAEAARLRRELAAERHAAHHDWLTGTLNRRGFYTGAQRLLTQRRPGGAVAAMILDLDGFKPVNDRFGHAAGDQLLATFAARLRRHTGGRWLVARLGGDEFAGLRPVHPRGEPLLDEARQLAGALAAPVTLPEGCRVHVRVAIGLTTGRVPVPIGELLGRADAAMYRAKSLGGPVLWDPRRDDDRPAAGGGRPLVRTRDLPHPRTETNSPAPVGRTTPLAQANRASAG